VREELFGATVEVDCYDPESWNKLWEDVGPFKTETFLREVVGPNGEISWKMIWSATRITRSVE